MARLQKELMLAPKRRGYHLVTAEIESQLPESRRYWEAVSSFQSGMVASSWAPGRAFACANSATGPRAGAGWSRYQEVRRQSDGPARVRVKE
jgi:hypothetical protein